MSSNTYKAKQWVVKKYPVGVPTKEDFELKEVDVDASKLEQGKVVIQLKYLSVDPYMRIRLKEDVPKGYFSAFPLGEPMNGGAISEVLESNDEKFKKGDIVTGMVNWQTIQIVDSKSVYKYHFTDLPLSYGLGILGMPGATSYFGLLRITEPKEGETVLVSGAAGAVGSVVGQIAKIKGCKVVGIAGSDEKCKMLEEEFGFDSTINYKKVSNIHDAIKEKCPDGFDIYFDNVGGETFDAAVKLIRPHGRLSICGTISSYNSTSKEEEKGISVPLYAVVKQLKVEGFLVSRWLSEWGTAFKDIAQWIKEGKLKFKVTTTEGFENTIDAFSGMLTGKNIGKQVVKV